MLSDGHSVLILAPTGQDAQLISRALEHEKVPNEIFTQPDSLRKRLGTDSGALLVSEEALTDAAVDSINQALASQEPWSDLPIMVMTTGGGTLRGSLRVLKAFAPAGNVTLLERPFRPITLISVFQVALRARERQYQVRRLIQEHTEATRVRDEFISVASHELRTPLTSLKLQAQLHKRIIDDGNLGKFSLDKVRKLVETTERQVDRLSHLVEDMLDVSRIGTGKLTLRPTAVDLGLLVREVVDRSHMQLAGAQCATYLDTPLGLIGDWDGYRIEQVINNLIMNAIRYSPGRPIWVTVVKEGESAVLRVRDEGKGIALENHERIFRRFERAEVSGNVTGLGLGLYISREIVEAHAGKISVQSAKGEGATFKVELPLRGATSRSFS